MCRSTDNNGFYYQRDRLKIKAFYLRLSISNNTRKPLPETITLRYLPRISENPLEINDAKIRSDADAYITLHRVRTAEKNKEAVFASRERVRVSEAVRFEVYIRGEKVLKGIFRKDDEEEWKLECECALERGCLSVGIKEAEVSVSAEGHVGIIDKVDMSRRRRKCRNRGFKGLDEIPEETELEVCDCCVDEMESEFDGAEDCKEPVSKDMEIQLEGVRWAVDVGIWVTCLGVGYLVSKASSKSLRRMIL